MAGLWNNCRSAWRALRRGRLTTALAIGAFALGIGATTAVFSLFYGVLLKPLPYPHPEQLVLVYDTQPACTTCPASFPKYVDWTTRNHVFSAIGGSTGASVIVTGDRDPERVLAVRTTASLIDVFQVAPAVGRWYTPAEDVSGGPKVVVLSAAYWARRFNSDPRVLERTLTIDGDIFAIIGVMPESWSHRRAELFLPLQRANDPATRGNHFLQTYARLKPGVSQASAQKEMIAIGADLAREFGNNHGVDVESYAAAVIGSVAQPLKVLMAAVSCVLLIACANIANLLLASGVARRRELAVRAALGATRADLAGQLIAESVVLALVGGIAGVALAAWLIRVFVTLAGTSLPRASTVGIDGIVVFFAFALALLTGLICGSWPVIRLARTSLAGAVREGDLRSGVSAGRRFGGGLIIVETALAFSLLVGSGLLVKNLLKLEDRDTGMKADHLVAFDLTPTHVRYPDDAHIQAFYDQLLPRLAAIHGVSHAAATSHLPMYQFGNNSEVTLQGGNPWTPHDAPLVEHRWITPDYFATLGIPIKMGRAFDEHDRSGSTMVVIISEKAAAKFWPGASPIGRKLKAGGSDWLEIVGVARDVRSFGLDRQSGYETYVPIAQQTFGPMTIALRTSANDPTTVIPEARKAVAAIDPSMPLARVQTMEEVVSQSVSQPRLISALTVLFGGLAGVLAALGVYGVTTCNVRRERREFGIRLALGATPWLVRRLVVGRGLVLGAAGIALGAAMALLMTRALQSLLSDVTPTDPVVYSIAAVGLVLTSVLACYLPARQASRTDPMIALRMD